MIAAERRSTAAGSRVRPHDPTSGKEPGAGSLAFTRSGRPLKLIAVGTGLIIWGLVLWRVLQPPVVYPLKAWELREMVEVPGGTLDRPGLPNLTVEPFWIDRTEVTEGEWATFLAAFPGEPAPFHWAPGRRVPLEGHEDRPIVWVRLPQAQRYATWRGKRLPTAIEWDWAARGRRRFPWGQAAATGLVANLAELGLGHPTPVGLFEGGRSPSGAYDMVGNVREWTATTLPGLVGDRQVVLGGSFRDSDRGAEREIWLSPGHIGPDPPPITSGAEDNGPAFERRSDLAGDAPPTRTIAGKANARADDLGFRCAMGQETVESMRDRARRVQRLVHKLGARDPLGYLFQVLPAQRELVAMGGTALPGLIEVRRQLAGGEGFLVDRVERIIARIRARAREARR